MTQKQRQELGFWLYLLLIYIVAGWVIPFITLSINMFIGYIAGIHMTGLVLLILYVFIHDIRNPNQ